MATVPGSSAILDEHRAVGGGQDLFFDSASPAAPHPVAGLTALEARFAPCSPQTNW